MDHEISTASAPPDGLALAATHCAVERLARLYEQLTLKHLPTLAGCYAPDAHFKDPFNDLRGASAIASVFKHMFATLDQPRFAVTERVVQAGQAFLVWEFRFRMRRWRPEAEQCIHGTTHVRFNGQGLIVLHRDYWDAAEELYEKLPLLGALMRWLRYRASH